MSRQQARMDTMVAKSAASKRDNETFGFDALGCTCEIQVQGVSAPGLRHLGLLVQEEVTRIERKYSRYRPDSVISTINGAAGQRVAIDAETERLLTYADQCWRLSDGLFDITSGALRRVWIFDGSDKVPSQAAIDAVLPLVGWDKVTLGPSGFTILPGMEIDFGGLGKEYAVDRARQLLQGKTRQPFLVNFGGDLCVSGPRERGEAWRVQVETPSGLACIPPVLDLRGGALATSGDSRRFLLSDGIRYSHILDPRTGWPIIDPPRSVTIAASTCMEAGIFSTLAMAHGRDAEAFLEREGIACWVLR